MKDFTNFQDKPDASTIPPPSIPSPDSKTNPHNNRAKGRRKYGHDYRAPWKYHITISKAPSCQAFSSPVVKNLTPDGVKTDYSRLGRIIWQGIKNLQLPYLRIYQYSIMPDHIHLLIHVKEYLPRHLGYYIAEFKSKITQDWRLSNGNDSLEIFERNYHDRLILPEHSLDDVYQYIRQNPYRLAVRRMRPEFFRKTRNLYIDGREIQAYGNLFLLRNPFKLPLVVHRADNDDVYNAKLEECLYFAENGGVIVSPFISSREKLIRKAIESSGAKIILIRDHPFGDRDKPAKHDFELCCEGRLLIISPLDYPLFPKSEHPPRQQCLDMNSLAKKITKKI